MIEYDTVKEALQALIEINNAKDIKVKGETIDFINLQELYQERIYNLADLLNMSELYLTDKQGGNNVKRNAEKEMPALTPEETGLIDGCTLSYQEKTDYEEMRMVQLSRKKQLEKDRYIVALELFLKDTLDRFSDKEMTAEGVENQFYNEYFGLAHQDGLLLIEGMQKYK